MANITMNVINEAVKVALANIDADNVLYSKKNADGEVTIEVKPADVLAWFDRQAEKSAKAAERSKAKAAEKRAAANEGLKDAIVAIFEENDGKPMTFSEIADAVEDIPTWQKARAVVVCFPDVFEVKDGKKKKEVHLVGTETIEG